MRPGLLAIIAVWCSLAAAPLWAADCTDLSRKEPIRASGLLEHRTFPGATDDVNTSIGGVLNLLTCSSSILHDVSLATNYWEEKWT